MLIMRKFTWLLQVFLLCAIPTHKYCGCHPNQLMPASFHRLKDLNFMKKKLEIRLFLRLNYLRNLASKFLDNVHPSELIKFSC